MSQYVSNDGEEANTPAEISKPLLRLKLLDSLRQADFPRLQQLFTSHDFEPLDHPDVQEVVQLTLHYAVQVAPFPLIKAILSNWTASISTEQSEQLVKLDVNKQDSDGNTPLHLAALQSRADVVQLLMDHDEIDDCITNNSRLQPVEMCKNLNIAQMMQVNRANYVAEIAHEFRLAFNNRDFSHLESILSNSRNAELLDINGNDPETGDTVLHEFVKKRDVIMCRWIIDHGGDPFKRDKRGRLPINSLGKSPADKDSTSSENTRSAVDNEIKQLLEKAAREQSVINVTNNLHEPPSYKGYLRKWTNFAQGYKLRWFILGPDGTLSYYKDQDDSTNACRGSLNVSTCYLHLDSSEKLKFEIIGGSNGTVRWHLKGNHPIETNKWVWAIQSAIRTAKDRELVRTPSLANNYEQQQTSVSSITSPKVRVTPPGGLQSLGTIQATQDIKSKSKNDHFRQMASQTKVARSNSGSSISSSDVELNDNLTDSGRQYVTKVKINRQQNSRLSDTSSSSLHHLEQTRVQKTMKHKVVMQEDPFSTSNAVYTPANEEGEDEDADELESLSHYDHHSPYAVGEDEEDLKVNYGPYAQELAILQRSILIEISTLNELLDDGQEIGPVINTAKKSLTTISKNFMQLNRLTEKRDKHLVKMLAKQRDINNLWINSVKELEMELLQKTEKLASMDNDRRSLKKLLQKKLNEATAGAENAEGSGDATRPSLERARDSSRQFAEIVEFIQSNESSDEEDSEIDEFFDAEDMDKDSTPYDADDVVSSTENPDTRDIESNLFHMEDESKQETPTVTTTSQKPFDQQFLEANPPSLDTEVTDLADNIEPTANAMKVCQEFTSNITADTIPETSKENNNIHQNELVDEHYATTEDQKAKQRMIYEEGTFLGYDDGLRKKLALTRDDRPKINLWSVLKSMIGKDMTRMSLPVAFNEPTSLLQRVAEDLEYSDVLDTASSFEDSTLRLLHIAAFLSSSYSSTTKRVAKPFNPLLGETFEYARPDKKYRFFTEQVSHHPPISATWTESPKWDFFGESYVDSKFYGRSFDIKHLGLWYLRMRPDNGDPEELYTWKKPDNSVIGILIGKPEIDNHGDVHIVNHTTGDYCLLHFKARGWRSANAYEVRGEVFDSKGVKRWVLGGHWNDAIYAKCVLKHNASEELTLDRVKNIHRRPGISAGPNYDGHKFMLWHVNDRPDSPFNLTSFAISLNALQPRLVSWLAPTDSRHRPDQRAMEEGRYDDATEEKRRVEEKQRATRREREAASLVYQPRWFKKVTHPITGQEYWEFNGEYWKMRRDKKLNQLENIF